MSVVRLHRRETYTVVTNDAIRDERLSWKATGLLVYLLGLPDGWRINHRDLAERKLDGKAAVLTGMSELEENGYLRRTTERLPDGTFRTEVHIFEEALSDGDPIPTGAPGTDYPGPDEPDPDNRYPTGSNQPGINQEEETSLAPLDGSDLPAVLASSPHLADAERLADLLADLIAENGSRRPTVSPTWVRDMERLLRLDERTAVQVEAAIRWSQRDDFWQSNILSPAKLRKQYDRMRLQARRDTTRTERRSGSAASMVDVLQQLDDQMERESAASSPRAAIEAG
jgi:hypothetical protein